MSTKVKLFSLTLIGIGIPIITVFIAAETGIHPYLMMGITAASLLFLLYNGIRGGIYGHRQAWSLPLLLFFLALNLLPALFFLWSLFPMWMASLMFV